MKRIFIACIACLFLLANCQKKEEPKVQQPFPAGPVQGQNEIPLLQELVKKDPQNLGAWIKLGNILMDSHRFNEATEAYQKALDLDPKNVDVRVDMGTCYRNIGNPQKAVEEYRKAITINPNHLNAHRNLGVVLAFDIGDKKCCRGVLQTARGDGLSPAEERTMSTGQDTTEITSVLLEIGTEEVPSRLLPNAIRDLKALAAKTFEEYRIDHADIVSYATPRRLSLIVTNIAAAQKDVVREVFGPATKAAFDDQGKPTKAAAGFAASLGIPVSSLALKQKGKGEYVVAVIEEKGSETRSVLPEILKKIILSLHFPKSMRWGNGSMTFVRPLAWILAISDHEKIDFEIDGLKSGKKRGRVCENAEECFVPPSAGRKTFVVQDRHPKRKEI